jgi:hypothetical protein
MVDSNGGGWEKSSSYRGFLEPSLIIAFDLKKRGSPCRYIVTTYRPDTYERQHSQEHNVSAKHHPQRYDRFPGRILQELFPALCRSSHSMWMVIRQRRSEVTQGWAPPAHHCLVEACGFKELESGRECGVDRHGNACVYCSLWKAESRGGVFDRRALLLREWVRFADMIRCFGLLAMWSESGEPRFSASKTPSRTGDSTIDEVLQA